MKIDLDLDGKNDTFTFVGSGSGFLALDKTLTRVNGGVGALKEIDLKV